MNGQLYVFDPRPFHADQFRKLFSKKKGFDEIIFIDSIDTALENVKEYDDRTGSCGDHGFFFCGVAYLYLFRFIKTLHAQIPAARFCVFDEKPYSGCGIIAERLHIHGYCSCYDGETEIHRCLRCLTQNTLVVAESMKSFLTACFESRRLRCHAEYRDHPLHNLNEKEFDCFLHIAAGKTCEQISEEWGLEVNSMNNFLLRIRKKLGINTTSQFVEIANGCGLGATKTADFQNPPMSK